MDTREHQSLLAHLSRLERELATVRRELSEGRTVTPLPDGPFPAVLVLVGGERYAIPSGNVRLIVQYAKLSKIPNAPAAVLGALNLRGEPVVVVDVAQRLGLGRTTIDLGTKVVFATIHGRLTGLVLDRVLGVAVFDSAALEAPSGAIASAVSVSHIGTFEENLVQILDLERLLSLSELELATALEDDSPDSTPSARAGHSQESAPSAQRPSEVP